MLDIKLLKCPQCGAPCDSDKCSYCKSLFDASEQKLIQAEILRMETQSETDVLNLTIESYEAQVKSSKKALGIRAQLIIFFGAMALIFWSFWIQVNGNDYYIGKISLVIAIIAAVDFLACFLFYGNYRKVKKALAAAHKRLAELNRSIVNRKTKLNEGEKNGLLHERNRNRPAP